MFGTTVSGSSKGSEILVWDSDAPKTKPAENFQDAKDAISAAVDDDENSTWGGNFFPPV